MSPEQPLPTPGSVNVTPVARQCFEYMLDAREVKGVATYGTTLQTNNGRDVFQDLLEELIDAWQYAIQGRMERAGLIEENARLRAEVARLGGQP